jgi:hypothetical protein
MFPNYKKKWKIFNTPDGWEDLDFTGNSWNEHSSYHDLCGTTAKIGRENGKLFKFCPRCMVILEK